MSPDGATPLKRKTGALARFLPLLGVLLRGLQEQARRGRCRRSMLRPAGAVRVDATAGKNCRCLMLRGGSAAGVVVVAGLVLAMLAARHSMLLAVMPVAGWLIP